MSFDLFGKTKGFGYDAPVNYLYTVEAGRVGRLMFGRFVPVIGDNIIGVKEEVEPKHITSMVKKGKLDSFDTSYASDDLHVVKQFAVAIEKVDIPGTIKDGRVPAVFVAAVVEHHNPDDEGDYYYSADRGLLYPGASVRQPVSFVMKDKTAALKKYGQMVDTWEEQSSEFLVGRFVRREADADWKFVIGEPKDSTLWSIFFDWLSDEEARKQAEIDKLMQQPMEELDTETFASLFQKQMVEGGGS